MFAAGSLLSLFAIVSCAQEAEPSRPPVVSTPGPTAAIVSSDVDFHRKRLHVRRDGPRDGQAVLLLHGMKYDSSTWESLGTLAALGAAGLHAVAVDVPGYGKSEAQELVPATFLEELIHELGVSRPVIVAPSLGGTFAFPYVAAHPELVAGFVPVAPSGLDEWAPKLKDSPVPVLIVWGSADTVFPVAQAEVLAAAMPNSRTLVFDGAAHAAYLERREEFNQALVEFALAAAASAAPGEETR